MPKTTEIPDTFRIVDPETGEFIYSPSLLELEEHALMMRNYLNPDGSENPDPTPIAPPIGYRKAPSLVDNMRAMIREHALAIAIAGQDAETFEESDDFDVADDYDPASPWEGEFEPIASITADEAAKNAAAAAKAAEPPPPVPATPAPTAPAKPAPEKTGP